MFTLAEKSLPLVAQNQKSARGSVWPKRVSISFIKKYGATASPSLLKFNQIYQMYLLYLVQLYRVYIQLILIHGFETWPMTRALEDRIAGYDNICFRLFLRIPYTDHVTNAEVRLRAGSPPQLLPLTQTRPLRFFWHVARTGDFHDLFRALHTSIHGLAKDWRRRPGRPRHTWLRTLEADLQPLNHGLNSAWRNARGKRDYHFYCTYNAVN